MVDEEALKYFAEQLKNDANCEGGVIKISKELAYEMSEIIERVLNK